MKKELISVIVPIYNVEKYLNKCVDSIINQSYKNIEIILVDDGSTDRCSTICDEYEKKDNRIIVIHKINGGLSSARNAGIEVAKGEFISFVDSDDYLELNMLEELKNNIDKFNSSISICDFYYVKNNKKYKRKRNIIEFVSKDKDKFKNIQNELDSITIYAWNKLYRRYIFEKNKYPVGLIYEDSYIICDLLNDAESVSYILKPLYNYVYRKNSILNKFGLNSFNVFDSFNKKIDFLEKKGYYDLVLEEKNRKMNRLIVNLSKMKHYHIKNKEIYKKYYKELLDTNKEVKWKNATWKNKLFKVLRRPSISILAFGLRVRDLIRR